MAFTPLSSPTLPTSPTSSQILTQLTNITTGVNANISTGTSTADIQNQAITSALLYPQGGVIAPSGANITSFVALSTTYTWFTWSISLAFANAIVDYFVQLTTGNTNSSGTYNQFIFWIERETTPGSGIYVGIMNPNNGVSDPIRTLSPGIPSGLTQSLSFQVSDIATKPAGTYACRLRYQTLSTLSNLTLYTTLSNINYKTYNGQTT
jgi:hypothetical protein